MQQEAALSGDSQKPTSDMTRAELEAWRAANPWPWFDDLRAYTLANSTQEVRRRQEQWEPIPDHVVEQIRAASLGPLFDAMRRRRASLIARAAKIGKQIERLQAAI